MCEVSAPASSANLGPGFDTLALALELRCRVAAVRSGEWSVKHVGTERPQHGDAVLDAARRVTGAPLELTVRNEIPIGKGLGSSAAAAAAGVAAAWRAVGHAPEPAEVFRVAAEIDGHADNAAAAVYGGLVSVTTSGEVHRLELSDRIRLVLAVPDVQLPTRRAREVLPGSVERDAVVRSLQRLVALVEGLRTGDPGMLGTAAGDELHEHPRGHLNPHAGRLIEVARDAGAWHACWSGAGPSVLALTAADRVGVVAAAMRAELADGGVVMAPSMAVEGLVGI
jgi:homoserine kinase